MKTISVMGLAAFFAFGTNLFAQTLSYDIATLVQPPGWKSTEAPGVLQIEDRRTVQGRVLFCRILVFASQMGNPNPSTNFLDEWNRKIAMPLQYSARPSARPETNAEGWTALTDHADTINQGVPVRVILYTATKSARFMSVVVMVSPNSYQNELVNFFRNLNFHDRAQRQATSTASTPAAPSQPAAAGAEDRGGQSASGSLANYVYMVPPGWNRQAFSDRISLASPVYGNGEACQITMLPFQQSSADLADVALGTFRQVFRADPLSTYPVPPGIIAKGVSPDGWEYFSLKKLVGGQEGEARTSGSIVLVVNAGAQVGTIIATSKDFMVSNCFGLLRGDLWPNFFYSLKFKNAQPSGREAAAIKQRLVGSWIMATGNAGLHFTFQSDGRYSEAVATQYRTRELETTTAFFGSGSYSFDNNTLILQRDDHTRFVYQFRLEQVSRDSGRSWTDELDMLEPGASGEVSYRRN